MHLWASHATWLKPLTLLTEPEPGAVCPDELVILGAHLDSWDLGQGTTDNVKQSTQMSEAVDSRLSSHMR